MFASLFLSALLARATFAGVLAVFGPNPNPSSFPLGGAVTAPSLSFSWPTNASRPVPGPFGALFLGTVFPPSPAPVWFAAAFGSSVGSFLRLWIDDHFLINAQARNGSAIGYYPLVLRPGGSLLRVEFAAIGEAPFVSIQWGPTGAGPWSSVPPTLLSPSLPPAEAAYQNARAAEEVGWNTWASGDMLASVQLPSGLSFTLSFYDARARRATARVNMACAGVRVGLHAARGNYTEIESLDLDGGAASVRVETALTPSGDLVLSITTLPGSQRPGDVMVLVAGGNALPFSACDVDASPATAAGGGLTVACWGAPPVTLRPSPPGAANASGGATLALPLPPPGAAAALSTAPAPLPLGAALAVVATRRAELLALFAPWGARDGMNETFAGLFTAVAWTAVYSPTQGVVNGEFGRSERLYEWDTLLAGALAARVDRWMAFNNIIRVAKGAVPAGFFPGFIENEFGEVDNSKPQVGALALQVVFARFGEAWVVELVIDALARFNGWWARARMVGGIVAPGSLLDSDLAPIEHASHDNLQAAKWETGLDNSPLYDAATYNASSGLMSQWDVGMHALLIADARAAAALAGAVGRSDLVPALNATAAAAAARMEAELWCEEAGAYLNKDYVTGAWVKTTGPPNAYPLLTGVPSAQRVKKFLDRYYFNASEWCGDPKDCAFGLPSISRADPAFKDQDYWRGRAWGPMNWLVWQALEVYAGAVPRAADAVRALAAQGNNTFLGQWLKNRHVMENYNAIDGTGCETAKNANPFYHWGALTALVAVEVAERARA
jgi:putative isomerase